MLPAPDPRVSIPARLGEIATRLPDALAVVSAAHTWTHARLNAEAMRIARALLREPGKAGEPVALLFRHDVPLVGALIGTLYAGRCFAVLDAGFPLARNREILENLGASILLTDAGHAADAAAICGHACRLMIHESLPTLPDVPLPGFEASADSPLGIFHTTGTTGTPKGVLWHQAMVIRRALTDREDGPIRCGDRFSLMTALCFPAAISDAFNALLNGASLHIYDMRRLGPAWLADWLRQEAIGCLRAPVALFRHLHTSLAPGERFADLRSVGLSGDTLSRQDVVAARRILPDDCRIIHRYSMSEAGMVARDILTADAPIETEIVSPGFVAPGKILRILDDAGQLASTDTFGEVALDLRGCAAGYWQNGRLVPLPSVPDPEHPHRRLYRSGDIGRFGADGRLELAGRQDHRVKIRGYRVELPAVEVALRGLPCVRDAAVAVHPDPSGEKALTGFVVPADRADAAVIRQELARVLPDYMVPSAFVLLAALPLAGNGKLDRKALQPARPTAVIVPPADVGTDSTTDRVLRIFADVLGRNDISPDDDFFALGGHSLLAARVLARVAASFDRRLSLSSFYRAPTIRALATAIESGVEPDVLPPEVVERIRLRALHDLGWL